MRCFPTSTKSLHICGLRFSFLLVIGSSLLIELFVVAKPFTNPQEQIPEKVCCHDHFLEQKWRLVSIVDECRLHCLMSRQNQYVSQRESADISWKSTNRDILSRRTHYQRQLKTTRLYHLQKCIVGLLRSSCRPFLSSLELKLQEEMRLMSSRTIRAPSRETEMKDLRKRAIFKMALTKIASFVSRKGLKLHDTDRMILNPPRRHWMAQDGSVTEGSRMSWDGAHTPPNQPDTASHSDKHAIQQVLDSDRQKEAVHGWLQVADLEGGMDLPGLVKP